MNAQWSAPALFAQNGQQSTIASLYKWAVSSPSVPSTTPSVWTWSSRTFSVGVSGWTTTPGAVVTGQTLWALNCTITDTATNTTTNFDWDTGVISAVAFPGVAGATGATGSTGSTGSTGNSACIAYSAVVGGSGALSGSPSTDTTTGITSLPATNTWGGSETWSTAQPGISAGYSLWQTNGIYSVATNQIVWGAPYLSSLKVGTLSAITANCGSITSGTITGTLIETSASYPNVVIDGSSNDIVINNASGVAIITLNGVATNPLIAEANIVYPVAYIQNTSTNSAGYALEATGNGGVGVYGYSTSSIAGFFQAGSARDAVQLDGGITPFANNAFNLGYSGASWSGIWSQTAVVVTSDERTKTDIRDSNIGLQFILDLKPIMYKHIVGLNIPTRTRDEPTKENPQPKIKVSYSPIPGIRNHYGLSAQQVKATMSKHGLDDAAFWTLEDKTDSNSQQALRYEEFLSPIIKAVQEQQALILDLTNRLIVLENKK